jgi:cytidyltransferase-like protein
VENGSKIIGIYGGGFKPPTKGHFEVVQQALKQFPEMDELIIYVGSGERDKVDQAESVLVWNIYKKHLPSKVSVESVKAPVGDIFRYAKDHPEETIYFILGAREGSEGDAADNEARTKSVSEKYPNIEVKIITTSDSGMSGTNARKALFQSKDAFFKYIPDVLSSVEKERVYTLLVPELISENASYAKDIDYKQYIKELTKDMIKKGMNVTPLPKVIFKHSDVSNAKDFFGKTAYYEPQSMSIVLYTEGRHPKDIVRSFAHEMIHHMQNVEGRLGNITTTNTQEDDNLNDLEAEANLKGTMTFRNWTDSINENIFQKSLDKTEKEALKITDKDWDKFGGKECNNGFCDIFAKHLSKYMPGSEIMSTEDDRSDTFGHVWVKYNNKYFDAETPDGVSSWKELPWMKKFYNRIGEYPDDITTLNERKNKDPFGITAYALELARGLQEQEETKYKIYVDMDGVLVDFDGGYEKLTGMTTQEADAKGPEFFWKPISKAGAKWWITLNWMSDGKQLWDYVKKYNPELLSAPSREEASRMGKRVWVKRELPGVKLILRSADKKQEFASPTSILIDDRKKNIEQWEAAGGVGILHTDAASTIKKLKELDL